MTENAANLTARFLEDISTMFPNTSFYRMKYDQNKKKYSPPQLVKQTELLQFNSDKKQNCLFYTPNGETGLYDGIRDKNRKARVFCLVVDRDDGVKFREGFDKHPSIIVQTNRGYHAYRLLKEPRHNDQLWEETGKGLAEFFGGDSVYDSSRLFRLPGSYYWKDGFGVTQTHVIFYDPTITYTVEDFSDICIKQKEVNNYNQAIKKTSGYSSVVDDINLFCRADEVLEKIGRGRWRVDGSVISEDGQSTGGYKYWNYKNCIVNFTKSKDYRPEGEPFSIVKKIIGNAPGAFKWFQENYGIGSIVNVNDTTQYSNVVEANGELLFEEITIEGILIKVDYENMTTLAYIEDTKNGTQKEIRLLTAAAKPIGYYKKDGVNFYIIYYKKQNEEGYFKISEMGRMGVLEKEFSKVGITIYAMKKNIKILVEYFQNINTEMGYVDKFGIYDEFVVTKAGNYILNSNGKEYYVDLGQTGYEGEVLNCSDQVDFQDVQQAIEGFGNMYSKPISLTAFTWFAMSILSGYVREQMGNFPILNFVGLTQSGKTTLRHGLMRCMGLDRQLETQAGTTEFSMMHSCVHRLPVNVSEFESADQMKINRDMFIKNNFDGSKNMRGTSNQTVIWYENNAPICMDGEIKSMNNAVYSRCITLFMNPKNKGDLYFPTKSLANYFVQNKDRMKTFRVDYTANRLIIGEQFKELKRPEKERIIDNYTILFTFAKMYEFGEEVEAAIIKQANSQFDMMSEDNIDKTIKLVLGTAIQHSLFVTIDEVSRELNVEFYVDVLKVNSSKVDEIKSQIQIVNHHFHGQDNIIKRSVNLSGDVLRVPLDHIFKNKNLHLLFNKTIMYMIRNIKSIDSVSLAMAIVEYAHANGYGENDFAVDLSSKFNLKRKDERKLSYTDI